MLRSTGFGDQVQNQDNKKSLFINTIKKNKKKFTKMLYLLKPSLYARFM